MAMVVSLTTTVLCSWRGLGIEASVTHVFDVQFDAAAELGGKTTKSQSKETPRGMHGKDSLLKNC